MYWLLWRNLISLGRNPMAFRVQVVQSVVCELTTNLKKNYFNYYNFN
jgi:hypothetical protein